MVPATDGSRLSGWSQRGRQAQTTPEITTTMERTMLRVSDIFPKRYDKRTVKHARPPIWNGNEMVQFLGEAR